MSQNTFGVHFIVRTNRRDKNNCVPIYAKININGQVLMLSLNHKIKSTDWDGRKELPKQKDKQNEIIKNAIESFKSRIYYAYSKIVASNIEMSASNLKFAIIGKTEVIKSHSLLETVVAHNINFESLIGIKYSKGSYKNYKTSLKYLTEFVPYYLKRKDIPLKDVDYSFCEAFFTFLTTEKSCQMNGANKQLQRLKKIVNEGVKKGFIVNNPIANYKLEYTPVTKTALDLNEINMIQNLKLNRNVLNNVKDIFLFQCYTGLSYSDVQQLSIINIVDQGDNIFWIKMNRQKTKIPFSVPLLEPALKILRKYGFGGEISHPLLPVLSNQKMNDNLKIIQELAGITKNLTTHLARHSFATTITLGNGIPLETVSRMLGHTKLSTTQIYAKVHDEKIGRDMKGLMEKLK